ncbi:AraC family transcriptional regulator [uncultured Aquimarina sp.]|uniref:AraC family transcriptional regulator n=1 Tax=uncultured Aquimarina sp. TaxID=575652 RepID=UPI00261102A0|nr:AraC family transcriptional regulator [uncultured Aquimarina sp.]
MSNKSNTKIAVPLERVKKSIHSSFFTGVYEQPYFNGVWHYHPEFELLLVTEGSGTRLVGDHGEEFKPNDLVLLGGLLPHTWISDSKYLEEDSEEFCKSIYVQFRKDIFGAHFIDIPELKTVRKVLKISERGLKIKGKNKPEIIKILHKVPQLSSFDQLLSLLKILELISTSDYELLASEDYIKQRFYLKSTRVLKVHEYIMESYQRDISVNVCAQMVGMTTSSFCRFFKTETSYTFTKYVNKIRIDFSKKLLSNTNISIKEIGYECGYNSVPYFNRQFKKIEGVPPFTYRKLSRYK